MSSILVVEQEARYVERVRDALVAEGWQVRLAASREAAFEASAAAVPALVVVAGEVAGAAELLRGFSQRVGGPGALLIAADATDEARAAADESLGKPFTDQELRLAVRRLLASKGAPKAVPASPGPASDARVLTSADIFGDVLAEMEGEGEMAVPATAVPPPPTLAPVPAPAPPPAAAATTTRIPVAVPATSGDVEKKLEQTLSGMLPTAPRPTVRPPTPQTAEQTRDVENLLSKTLAGLEMPGRRPDKPVPAVAKAPPPAAPTVTQKLPASPAPPAKPAGEKPRAPAGPPKGAFDAQLDELTGAHRRPAAPTPAPPPQMPPVDEIFATQRIETVKRPPLASPPPSPVPARPVAAPVPPPAVAAPAPAPAPPPMVSPAPPAPVAPPPMISPAPAAPRASEPPTRADEPREFGQYTLLDRIAIGGMAEVWKARMKGVEGFQKTVAIKKILPHLTDSVDFVTMFIDEAKLAAQLNHNNIIHIYDLGKIADDYYIAMEYVEGRDLRSILNSGRHNGDPLPLGLALLIAARLASALDYAHRKKDFDNRELGLVHRDVSPQNVLISYEGDIKLCDFGIVKAVAKASKTQMGALKGKLQYMSPEQSWGRSVDARSDIFSMGSVLFEMLTGRRLFAGDSEISVLEAVRECRIQAPRDVIAALPEEVNRLVMKALAKDPDDRFQSAGEMQKELEKLLYGLKPTPSQDDLGSYMQRLYGIEPRAAAPLAAAPTVTKQQPAAKPEPAPRDVPAKVEVRSAPTPSVAPHIEPVVPAADARPLESEEQEKKGRWVPIAAILALAVIGGAYWFFKGGKGADPAALPQAPTGETTTAPEGGAVPAPAGEPGASSVAPPVDTAAVAAQLVEQEAAKRAAELQQQGDAEVKRLEAELARTQQAAPPPAKPTAVPTPAAKPTAPAAAPTPSAADQQAEAERLAQQQAEAERLAQQQAEAERAAQAAAAAPAAAPAPTPEPAAPAPVEVKVGDLVTAGLGVIPPVVVSSGRIEYPMMAKRMRVEGAVVLQVLVDENGAVLETRVSKPAAQNVGFNEAAVAAAKGFKFRPATKNGVRVKMWTTLNIPFRLTA
jgi:TonB family protein